MTRHYATAVEEAALDPFLDWVLVYRALHGIPVQAPPRERALLAVVLHRQHGWLPGRICDCLSVSGTRMRQILTADIIPEWDPVPM